MARTHGRPSTYNNGKCRCQACRDAIADYRAARRAAGLDLAPKTDETLVSAGSSTKGST